MDLSSPDAVREFLALCLDPGHGIKRTPATLAKIMPGPLGAAVDRFAPHLAQLREAADQAEQKARAARDTYTDALAAWITGDHSAHERDHIDGVPWPQCLACSTEAHTVDWTVPDRPTAALDPGQCPQNRVGTYIYVTDPAQYGPHFYQEHEAGDLRCVFCEAAAHWGGESLHTPQVPAYVHNAQSVNRTTVKHLVSPLDPHTTLCPRSFTATAPMPPEEAARLPLCGGCRDAATGVISD